MSRNSHDPFNHTVNSGQNANPQPARPMTALRVLRNGVLSTTLSSLPPTIYIINQYIPAAPGTQVGLGFGLMTPALICSAPWAFSHRIVALFDDTLGGQIASTMLPMGITPLLFMVILALMNAGLGTEIQFDFFKLPLLFFVSTAVFLGMGAGFGASFYAMDHHREIGRACRSRNRGEASLLMDGEIVGNQIVTNSEHAPLATNSLRQKVDSLFACCSRRPQPPYDQSDIEATDTPQNYQSTPGNSFGQ